MAPFLPIAYPPPFESGSLSSSRSIRLQKIKNSNRYGQKRLKQPYPPSAWANAVSSSLEGVRIINSSCGRQDTDMEGRIELPADRPLPSCTHDAHHVQTKRRSNVKIPRSKGRQHQKSVTFEDNPPIASNGSESVPETVLRVPKHRPPMFTTIVEKSKNGGHPRSGIIVEGQGERFSRSVSSPEISEARLRAIADARDAYLRAQHAEGFTERQSSQAKRDGYEKSHHKSRRPMRQGRTTHKNGYHEIDDANEDKLLGRGANPRTGIISPSVTTNSSQDEKNNPHNKKQKWRLNGDQWISLDADQPTPEHTPPTGQSAVASKNSALSSHGSASASATSNNWEDRFVVNMPSAREPNPPTMTVQQILEYQKSMEKVHREGGKMLDPDALPSPRAVTPEGKDVPTQKLEKQPSTVIKRKPVRNFSGKTYTRPPVSPPLPPRQYYNADDVGRNHVRPIDDGSPRTQEDRRLSTVGETFLGCQEINKAKGPDEILVFPVLKDSPYPAIPLSPVSKRKSAEKRRSDIKQKSQPAEEKTILHDGEKPPPFLSSKPIQCSKQPLSNPPGLSGLNKPLPKSPKRKSLPPLPKESSEKPLDSNTSGKENRSDDDVFIITPTITHTLIPNTIPTSTTDLDVQYNQSPRVDNTLQVPRKSSRLTTSRSPLLQQVQMSSGRSEMLFMMPPGNTPRKGVLDSKNKGTAPQNHERSSIMSGYIRTSRMMTSEQDVNDARDEHEFCLCRRCIAKNQNPIKNLDCPLIFEDIPRLPTPRFQDLTAPPSPVQEERPKSSVQVQTPRTAEIAELDGQQVHASENPFHEQDGGPVKRNENKDVDTEASGSAINLISLALLFDIFLLSVAQLCDFARHYHISDHATVMAERVFEMAEHCFHVARRVLNAIVIYKRTGSWPKSNNEEIALLMRDMGQACIYFFVLGFVIMIIGRAAGYIVLFGSWVVWFAKPFGWVFGKVGKILLI